MKISIITTITNPKERQDAHIEAITCYSEIADQVIVVDGSKEKTELPYFPNVKHVMLEWPEIWSWEELPRHLNRGLIECDGDWAIRMDIDYFFHEDDDIRAELAKAVGCKVVNFMKFSHSYGNKFNEKGPVPIAINLSCPDIWFGQDVERETDLCYPIEGTDLNYKGVPKGKKPEPQYKSAIRVWNYDATFRTKENQKEIFHTFSKAYKKYFNKYKFGSNKEQSFQKFIDMMDGRHDRSPYTVAPDLQPKWIKSRIKNIEKERFGHSGWKS